MKGMKLRYILLTAAFLALLSCAKEKPVGLNDDAKRYLDAWISQNHPAAIKTALGAYLLSETPGTGIPSGDSLFIRLNYTNYSLSGSLNSTTDEMKARQVGNYNRTSYYGPVVAYRGEDLDVLPAGLEEAVSTMKVGGRKTLVIPGWLSGSDRYDSEDGYLKNCSGTDYIYEIELVDAFNDADRWERDSLLKFMAANYPTAVEDTAMTGFFYVKTKAGLDKEFPYDTTFNINYTGRLLNGQIFDTTIKDSAKVWGLYSSSKEYGKTAVKWNNDGEDFSKITLGSEGTEVITGFAYALSLMHPGEAGKCFFISKYGYSASGSGSGIPGYSPLCFELETVEASE